MPNTNKHTPTPWKYEDGMIESAHPINLRGEYGHVCDLRVDLSGHLHDADGQHIVRCVNEREELLAALKWLIENVPLHKLNVRKDFSLMNAHAYANKVLHHAKKEN